jgi:guanylate kinase
LESLDINTKPRSAHLFIIAAPSGGGKTTLCREVRKRFSDMLYSVSYTTRKLRDGEQEGVDYHFIGKNDFENGIAAGKWAEWALVHGNYYGTSADFLDKGLADGRDILLDIDVQGPPSLEVLQQRLEARGTDSAESIAVRLKNAEKEMSQQDLYHHLIVNDQLSKAVPELISIIDNYRTTDNPRREG